MLMYSIIVGVKCHIFEVPFLFVHAASPAMGRVRMTSQPRGVSHSNLTSSSVPDNASPIQEERMAEHDIDSQPKRPVTDSPTCP